MKRKSQLGKKIVSLVLSSLTVFALASCGGSPSSISGSEKEKPEHLGLYVAEDGTLMKDGEPFYGIGVNYYSLMNRIFKFDKWDPSNSLAALETLKSYDVRAIRFNLCGYTTDDWGYYVKKKDLYYAALDAIVEKCEELEIGLIPTFFWSYGSECAYVGETVSTGHGMRDSESMQFVENYVEEVVLRYKDSPAIYGWEFTNEANLLLSVIDDMTYSDYLTVSEVFMETIRRCDPYNRMIGTGDAICRRREYQLISTGGWGNHQDTLEEHEQALDGLNQYADTISYHMYGNGDAEVIENPGFLTYETGDTPYTFSNWNEFFQYVMTEQKRMKKAAYIGEVASMFNYWSNPKGTGTERGTTSMDTPQESVAVNLKATETIIDAAVDNGVQLLLWWTYDDRSEFPDDNPDIPIGVGGTGGTEYSFNEKDQFGKGKGILTAIKNGNEAYDKKYGNGL